MNIRDRIKELRRVPANKLRPSPRNWRTHPKSQRNALQGVLAEVGIADAAIARELDDGTLELIDGHLRADILGSELIPVLVLDVTRAEADMILATLDPLAAMAEADSAKLDELLKDLNVSNEAVTEMLADLAKESGIGFGGGGEVVEDEVPEVPAEPVTKPGDLWLLGGHRILCGDSTKAEDVERLMAGERAGLMNTDPPYGVAYANEERPNPGVAKPRVANDALSDEALQEFLESAFRAAVDNALLENAAWYMWHAHLTQGYFAAAAAAAANVVLHRQIIWVKPVLLLGRGQYHWKHEPCFMGWVRGKQPPDYGEGNGERTQTTVWEIKTVTQTERKELNHATPKPVQLFAIPIIKHLNAGEVCYEPFAGSGPQFIAAEQLKRRCFGLEIAPQYVDVCCERYRKLTGNQPTLEETGETFEQVRERRGIPAKPIAESASKHPKAKKQQPAAELALATPEDL